MTSNAASEASFSDACHHLSELGGANPVFRNALVLAHTKGLDLTDALQLIHLAVSPLPAVNWGELGHPNTSMCLTLSRIAEAAATVLERNGQLTANDIDLVFAQNGMPTQIPDLLVYATLRSSSPCNLDDLIGVFGAEAVSARLRGFSKLVGKASLVS